MPNPLLMHPCHTRPSHLTAPVSRLRKALSIAALTLASCLLHSIAAQTPAAKSIPSERHPSLARPKSSPSAPQPGTASFLGNFTTITDPSQSMMLVRGADCTLSLVSGNYSLQTGLTYTGTGLDGSYERVLHTEAGLTTTPDVFTSGCTAPFTGFESATAAYLGTTTQGIDVIAVVAYSPLTQGAALYLISGTDFSKYTLDTYSFASAGLINTADLNKDGNGDLVVLNSGLTTAGSISVLLGKPDGTVQTAVTYPTAGSAAQSAVIDDFNGDGKLDIAVVSAAGTSNGTPTPQQVSILLGNGDGTFQPAHSFTIPELPGSTSPFQTAANNIISASLRGNGKKDLILSNGLVFLGNGDGTFAATATPPLPFFTDYTSGGPYLASGDVNNDGKTDVVLSNGSSVNVFLGNGDGTFKTGNSYDSLSPLYSAGYVTISDLDGDGNPDIYVGIANGGLYLGDSYSLNQAYALMGNGDGTFQGAPQAVDSGTYTGNNLGDVNGDGQPDLITNLPNADNTFSTSFSVQLGTPKGFFTPSSTITTPSTFTLNGTAFTSGGAPATYAVADVNGDGKADLVFLNTGLTALNAGNNNAPYSYAYPVLFVALSNGDGTFKTPVPYTFPQLAPAGDFDNSLTVSNLQIADFNKDGHPDLILTYNDVEGATFGGPAVNAYDQGFVVFLGNGDGTFKTTPLLTPTYSSNTANNDGNLPYVSSIADLNGDGIPDLVVLHPYFTLTNGAGVSTTQLVTYLGNGDGTFKPPVAFPSASNVLSPVLADFNKDGKLDVAFINAADAVSAGRLEIALGNGDGTFKAPTTNLSIFSGAGLAAADFNGDGNPDLALFGEVAGVFYGNGDGTLSSIDSSGTYGPTDLIQISTGSTAVAVDLNHDGKPDILAGGTALLNLYGATPPFLVLDDLAATTIQVTSSASTVSSGSSVTLTGTIVPAQGATATPSGIVTFLNGEAILGSASVASNKATFTTSTLAPGTYNLLAVYEGDANFTGNLSTPITLTVTPSTAIATTTTLTSPTTTAVSGASITFTATLAAASGTAAPTGTVSFLDGTTNIGTGNLTAGVATFTTSTLATGPHSITASYAGVAGAFNPSTSIPAIVVTITATAPPTPGFTISLSSTTASISPGSTASTTLSLTPSGGFSAATSLTCSGAVTNTTCTIAPASLTPTGTTASTATITLTTTAQASLKRLPTQNATARGTNFLAALPAGILLSTLLFGLRRRTSLRRLPQVLAFAAVALLLAATGCGGKSTTTTTTPAAQTDTLTITATSGSIVQSTTWTVSILP
jgi:hypothetical protein